MGVVMGTHLLQATAVFRSSVLRFGRCDGQVRYVFAFPLRVVGEAWVGGVGNGSVGARGVVFEPHVRSFEGRGGAFSGFRRFTPRSKCCRQGAFAFEELGGGEDFDAHSDDEDGVDDGRVYEAGDDYIVVNFYHFVGIEDARHEVARHSAFVEVRIR